ncbi:MAG: amidohydrolase family protein [Myxococcota bacterium]
MQMEDMVIASVDDHLVEPPDMFKHHLPADIEQPRVVEIEGGAEIWTWGDTKVINIGLNAVVGRPKNEWGMEPARFSHMRKAAYDVDARVDDMNVNGTFASLCFGTFIKFDGSTFLEPAKRDPKNAYRVLQAYNDWHIDEWCGAHPTRFIPLANLPLWDPELCAEEIRRVEAKGCHAVTFPTNPAGNDLPSLHDPCWEPVWKVCNDLQIILNCHIGTGSAPPHPSLDSPIEAWITGMPISIANSASDWITLQAFQRYPDLKMALSEGGIGWVPYLLERADFTNRHHRAWTNSSYGDKKPSDIFRDHIITCFIEDDFGLANRHAIGIDNITLEVDYPHSDCLWPDHPEGLWRSIQSVPGGIPDDELNQITHENVLKLYRFDGMEKAGGRANCTIGALRKLGEKVDTREVSLAGKAPRAYEEGKIVTSRDALAALGG